MKLPQGANCTPQEAMGDDHYEGEAIIRNNFYKKEFLTTDEAIECILELSERMALHNVSRRRRDSQKKYG